jgi:nitrate/TMAO reductase-like tetraheme cytochrome c subunit
MFDLYHQLLTRKIILGTTVGVAIFFMVIGVIFWGGFNTAMEVTNSLEFCVSCHEMEDNVYKEYKETIHYTNRAGVRATCSNCHVPDPWVHKVVRKIQASNEVFHKILGTINTPEKFDAKRLKMAKNVWKTMKETDSRECRNCHDFDTMDPENQKSRARKQHLNAMKAGNTCIDCHKGIAHKKVHDQLTDEEVDALEQPDPSIIRPIAPQWLAFEEGKNTKKTPVKPVVETTKTEAAPVASKQKKDEPAPVKATAAIKKSPAPAQSQPGTSGGFNWSGVAARTVTVFYPGQSSMEWILGRQHGGKRAFKSGDRCFDCHEEELAEIGERIVTGEKEMKVGKKRGSMEPTVIPDKRGSFPVSVQASYDAKTLRMRFQWQDGDHTPAPFVKGGKMDPDNKIKLAIMFATDEVEYADRAGCWGTCHADLRSMPYEPDQAAIDATSLQHAKDGISKYISESRTKINLKDRKDPLGGWDKLKDDAEIKSELDANHFMDLIRYKAGEKIAENGHILKERIAHDGIDVMATGTLNNGTWTVDINRPLNSDKPGDLNLDTSAIYNIGFAIHDDYTNARYHHVSLGYKLGFDNAETEINAQKK